MKAISFKCLGFVFAICSSVFGDTHQWNSIHSDSIIPLNSTDWAMTFNIGYPGTHQPGYGSDLCGAEIRASLSSKDIKDFLKILKILCLT